MFAMLERLVRSNSTVGNKKRPRLEQRRLRLQLESLEDRCEVCGVMPTAFDDEYWWTADEFESLTVDVPGVLGNDNPGGPGGRWRYRSMWD
jgi:hypothetical protein